MKKLITLAFVISSFLSQAQYVLQNGNNLPPVGFKVDMYTYDRTDTVHAGAAGNGVTWDFSKYDAKMKKAYNAVFRDVSKSDCGDSFASSNVCFDFGPNLYYQSTSDRFLMTGVCQGGNVIKFRYPRTLLVYPFSLGGSSVNNWGDTAQYEQETIVYDGVGTFKILGKTYTDVMRVKSTIVQGSDASVIYNYYLTANLMLLANVREEDFAIEVYIPMSPLGINEPSASELTVYPNPANEQLTLTVTADNSSPINFEMYNMLGELVQKSSLLNGTNNLNVSSLKPGLYIYKYASGNGMMRSGKIAIN